MKRFHFSAKLALMLPPWLMLSSTHANDDWSFDFDHTIPDTEQTAPPADVTTDPLWWQSLVSKWFYHKGQADTASRSDIDRLGLNLSLSTALADDWYSHISGQFSYARADDDFHPHPQQWHWRWLETWVQTSDLANDVNCNAKLGKFAIVWGKVDGVQALDVISPLDLTQGTTTDLTSLRQLPWAIQSECHANHQTWQLFWVPQAQNSRLNGLTPQYDLGHELGGKWQWQQGAHDVELAVARLQSNLPNVPLSTEDYLTFHLLGFSHSYRWKSWLFSWDLAYRDQAFVPLSTQTAERMDVALGADYLSATQHQWGVSLWAATYLQDATTNADAQAPFMVGQWRKAYWHDTLNLSGLLMLLDQYNSRLLSLGGQYQWNDVWSTQVNLSRGESDLAQNPLGIKTAASFTLEAVF